MTVTLQKEVPSILILTALLCILCVVANGKMKKFLENPFRQPTGLVFAVLTFVEWIEGMVAQVMGAKRVEGYAPYIGSLALYLVVANLSGLFGFNTPTMNLSVTLALAAITWVLIQRASLKTSGVGSYVHGLFEPFPFMVAGNVISKFTPFISLSMRLFGNILSGSVLMSLVYSACSSLTNLLFGWTGLSSFNICGVAIAPILHAYFGVFSGCIQMYIFISLTMAFVSNELGEE